MPFMSSKDRPADMLLLENHAGQASQARSGEGGDRRSSSMLALPLPASIK